MQTNKKILINKEDIIPTAQRMRDEGRMLLLIHGHRDTEGQPVICYDYFVGDVFESYEVRGEETLPDISPIYDLAAAWPEREINELIGVTFEGLDCSERLFLPENMAEEMKGQILVTPLEELRKARNISQEELAAALEVSRQTIGSLERGRYNPSILLAFKIARYFDLTIEDIFIYEEDAT